MAFDLGQPYGLVADTSPQVYIQNGVYYLANGTQIADPSGFVKTSSGAPQTAAAGSLILSPYTTPVSLTADTRKLFNLQNGGLSGKKFCWAGDSTSFQMSGLSGYGVLYGGTQSSPNPATVTPGMAGTLHYNRGVSGMTLASWLISTIATSGTTSWTQQSTTGADNTSSNYGNNSFWDCSLPRIVAEKYDCVIVSIGINDVRGTAAFTSAFPDYRGIAYGVGNSATAGQYIASQLLTLFQALIAGNPNITIIARMPNPGCVGGTGWIVPPGGGAAITPADGWNVLSYAYRYLSTYNLANLLVWDSTTVFPDKPAAGVSTNPLMGSDSGLGLHPSSPSGYIAIMQGITQIITPQTSAPLLLSNQQAIANNKEGTLGWGPRTGIYDPSFYQDSDDWYAVANVGVANAGSNFFRVAANEIEVTANNAAATLFGVLDSGGTQHFGGTPGFYAPPALVAGDVIVFPNIPYVMRVVNVPQYTNPNFGGWDCSAAATNISGSDDNLTPTSGSYSGYISNNPSVFNLQTGTIYRHKNAYSSVARALQLAVAGSQAAKKIFQYQYRFQVCYRYGGYNALNGWALIQPIPNDYASNGKLLSDHTIGTSDVLCLVGCDGANMADGALSNYTGLVLTSATITNPSSNQASTSVTAVTIANPGVFTTSGNHSYSAGQAVFLGGTAAPGGFNTSSIYYVTATSLTANTFTLASTPGGTAIQATSTGTAVTVQAVPLAATIQLSGIDFSKFVFPQGILFSAT